MKALVKKAKGKGQIELMDYALPQVKEGYVFLRIEAAGICGSDLKIYNDDHPYFPPVILGHEFSGEVFEVGPGVQGWNKGDRVVSEVHGLVCGRCRFCLSDPRDLDLHENRPSLSPGNQHDRRGLGVGLRCHGKSQK